MNMRPFEQWMIAQGATEKTRRDLLSRCDRVCRCEQCDLDEEWDKDRCAHILELFTYTVADERAGRLPNHHVKIDGNVRIGTSALRAALVKYVNFKNETSGEMIPAEEDEDEVEAEIRAEINEDDGYNDDELPFDPAQIDIEVGDAAVYLICERIKNNEIEFSPNYQRKAGIWNKVSQSRLIESMLLGIPLPMFYFANEKPSEESAVGGLGLKRSRWQIVDGLQRLCAIRNFIVESPAYEPLKLAGLQYLKSLNGKTYKDLHPALQRTLLEVTLRSYVIRSTTPIDVKLNIFRRLNTGGLPLSMQEIRHAMHPEASSYLQKLAGLAIFRDATKHQINDRRLGDQEYVNRFLAFYLQGTRTYKGMDKFLHQCLKKIKTMSVDEREGVQANFADSLSVLHSTLGEDAFVRFDVRQEKSANKINKALFETLTACVARLNSYSRKEFASSCNSLPEYRALFADPKGLTDLVQTSTGVTSRVLKRYEIIADYLYRITGEKINWEDPV